MAQNFNEYLKWILDAERAASEESNVDVPENYDYGFYGAELARLDAKNSSSEDEDVIRGKAQEFLDILTDINDDNKDFDSEYQYKLGMRYAHLDTNKSLELLKLAAAKGHVEAQYELGVHYGDLDTRESLKWFKLAAEEGHARAEYELGVVYRGKAYLSPKQSSKWFELAAAKGHVEAQYELSVHYADLDTRKSLKWLKQAAEEGHVKAQCELGDIYGDGELVPQDFKQASKWYRLAAEKGLAEAQYKLGNMYYCDLLDFNESLKRVRPAAEKGIAEAQYRLGEIYSSRDTEQSSKWFELAAAKGHAKAQHRLGNIDLKGKCIDALIDGEKALKWITLAAKQGHAEAQYNLGEIYNQGLSVPQDLDVAFKWFELAAEQGHKEASQYIADSNKYDRSQKDDENAKTDSEHALDVRPNSGKTVIGCEDIDLRLVAFLAEQFEKESGLDLRNDPLALKRLKEAAQKAKIELSSSQQAEINLPYITADSSREPLHLVQILTRAKFESLAEDLIDNTMGSPTPPIDDAPVRIRLGKGKNGFNEDINRSQAQEAEKKVTEKEPKNKAAEASAPLPTTSQKPSQENYAEAFIELENNKMKIGLWAMIFAHSTNVEEAKKSYIKLRAEELHNQQQEINKQK